jgi:hypothetical protein
MKLYSVKLRIKDDVTVNVYEKVCKQFKGEFPYCEYDNRIRIRNTLYEHIQEEITMRFY